MNRAAALLFLVSLASALHAGPALRVQYYPSSLAVTLQWPAVAGATSYNIERTSAYPAWSAQVVGHGSTTWTQYSLSANTTYIYRVIPRDSAGNPVGTPSNPAVITTHTYADNPLDTEDSVALQHVLDLRAAVASVRAAAGAGGMTWTQNPLTTDSFIADEDVNDLRTGLNAAYANLGLPLPAYEDPVLTDALVRRAHFQQIRDLARAYPELVVVLSATASELYFSPNADGAKDTTTFNATVGFPAGPQRVDFRWRVDVRSQTTSAVVRSVSGSGTAVAFAWDGKDAAGNVQPEAVYGFELVDRDSLANSLATAFTRLDVTAPVATISTPADGLLASNIRMAGGGNVAVTGSASDTVALQQWLLERTGNSQAAATISSGTTSVSSGSFGTWQTLPVSNGSYALRLTVTDKAGNAATDEVPVTVGHFSASRNVAQANAALNETVTYTAVVPYPVNLRLEVRRSTQLVTTLFDGPKTAGTHSFPWTGLQSYPDGVYQYIATVTDGTYSYVWDKSTSFPSGPATTQYEYPKCWNGTAWVGCDAMPSNYEFDPFGGKPLRISYCAGSGQPTGALPQGGCTALGALVTGKVTTEGETTETCDSGCFINEYQAGRQELLWFGLGVGASYIAERPRMTVIRKYTSVPSNATVLYGTAPVITDVTVSPPMLSPSSVPAPVSGQTYAVTVTRHAGRAVGATVYFRNLESGATLRTLTVAPQNSDTVTFNWDGRADDPAATRVAAGTYEVQIIVTDAVGSRATVRIPVVVRY
ncbi:MAG TPA: Ig-like domain repeat protein [Thermoanaerobaculia bacterium]